MQNIYHKREACFSFTFIHSILLPTLQRPRPAFFCVWKSVVKLVWLARWGYLSLHCPLKKEKKRKLPDFPKEVCWCYYCRYYFFSFNFYLTAAKPEPLVFVARGMRSPRIEMLGGAGTDFFFHSSPQKRVIRVYLIYAYKSPFSGFWSLIN